MVSVVTASQLRERITIQSPAAGSDSWGQQSETWSNLVTGLPARVTPVRANRSDEASGVVIGSITVVVRHRTDITPDMRIVWRGTAYSIQGFPADIGARREGLEMLCVRTPASGDA
jgi:SPP1 family predicted phage head-tail adaptor